MNHPGNTRGKPEEELDESGNSRAGHKITKAKNSGRHHLPLSHGAEKGITQ